MSPTDVTSRRAAPRETLSRIGRWLREKGPGTLVELAINLGLPFLIYRLAHPSLGDVGAMMASSAPPLGWSIIRFVRRRKVDALSLLVLAGIALSLIGFLGGGGVRFLQLREHLVAAAIGLVFLGSAAIGKPLIRQLSRARLRRIGAGPELDRFEGLQSSPIYRRATMTMTLAWGVGLIAESAVSCALIFVTTIPQFMVASRVVGISMIGGLTAWTFWYARRRALAAMAVGGGEVRASPETSAGSR